jgi:ubiquinone/menaquinone biosynthesis C-methylase UbiE/intracellular sulfur oxidation DsrE/DsrF family protein
MGRTVDEAITVVCRLSQGSTEMNPIARAGSWLLVVTLLSVGTANAQDKSVKPGINDSFRDPNVQQFQGRFETESREVFARRQEILAACELKPGQVVADIGAGTGLFTRMFAETVGKEGRVIAVDISQKFLDHIDKSCRAAGVQNVETLRSTAESSELPAECVDVAFICDTYHHFEFPLKTMASIHRALKPVGRVIVVDFRRIPGTSTDWVLDHVRAGQDVVTSEIVQAGFRKTREPEGVLKENYVVEFTKGWPAGLKPLEFPLIAGYGGVVKVANAVEKPQQGAKVLFDVSAAAPPQDVNKGLERAARLLNLYSAAGLKANDVKIAVVLHGEATKSALNEEFYRARFQVEQNPNLPLIRELQKAGVELFVCGQALNYKGFPESAVVGSIPIADSALTVSVNKQTAGYAAVAVP